MRRVTRGPIVLLTFDPSHRPWLTDYLPERAALDERQMPQISQYAAWLASVTIAPVMVPHDCTDGFLYAYWRRPEAYLDARIRSGSSSFWSIQGLEQGLARLSHDLETRQWDSKHGHLRHQHDHDAGYRLVIGNQQRGSWARKGGNFTGQAARRQHDERERPATGSPGAVGCRSHRRTRHGSADR
jgi:hypothetical protein